MNANLRNVLPGLLRGRQPGASGIQDAVYLADQRELQITFRSGRSFAYEDVPQSIYDAFMASPSKGAFFAIAIRGRFHFREMISAPVPLRH